MTVVGCIADDYTGATDVAAGLKRTGMSVELRFGVPDADAAPRRDAIVVALKSRTIPARVAVDQSLASLRWLALQAAQHIYFKYCSTFDSTDDGNIGPVADALATACDQTLTLICPATPAQGRTVYMGNLFVGESPLSESSMRHHPLTPMTDSNLIRILARQARLPVSLLPLSVVRAGPDAIESRLDGLRREGARHVVADATTSLDLAMIATAARSYRLLTGAAGLATALGTAWQREMDIAAPEDTAGPMIPDGPAVVLAGSCSTATMAQVAFARSALRSYQLDPVATPLGETMLADADAWLRRNWGQGPLMIYSTAGAARRRDAVAIAGADIAHTIEATVAELARSAVELGARRLVVAGGETSGAVISALDIKSAIVAREEDRGVPWCVTTDGRLALLLKSGNFGQQDLLLRSVGDLLR